MGSLAHPANDAQQILEVFLVFNEIDVRRVDHEKRGFAVVEEEFVVGLDHFLQIGRVNLPLELSATPPDTTEQHVEPRLEVDDQIRLADSRTKRLEYSVVEPE